MDKPVIEEKNSRTLLERLQFLSDDVFILTMTLMVLQFDLPTLEAEMNAAGAQVLLQTLFDNLGIYIITFVWIAFYWLENVTQFQYYQRTDIVHAWIQLLYIMGIAIIPYSNALATDYSNDFRAQLLLNINIIIIGGFSYLNWVYATTNHHLVSPNLDEKLIANEQNKSLIEPVIALICIGLGLISPTLWDAWMILFPVGYLLLQWWERRINMN